MKVTPPNIQGLGLGWQRGVGPGSGKAGGVGQGGWSREWVVCRGVTHMEKPVLTWQECCGGITESKHLREGVEKTHVDPASSFQLVSVRTPAVRGKQNLWSPAERATFTSRAGARGIDNKKPECTCLRLEGLAFPSQLLNCTTVARKQP